MIPTMCIHRRARGTGQSARHTRPTQVVTQRVLACATMAMWRGRSVRSIGSKPSSYSSAIGGGTPVAATPPTVRYHATPIPCADMPIQSTSLAMLMIPRTAPSLAPRSIPAPALAALPSPPCPPHGCIVPIVPGPACSHPSRRPFLCARAQILTSTKITRSTSSSSRRASACARTRCHLRRSNVPIPLICTLGQQPSHARHPQRESPTLICLDASCRDTCTQGEEGCPIPAHFEIALWIDFACVDQDGAPGDDLANLVADVIQACRASTSLAGTPTHCALPRVCVLTASGCMRCMRYRSVIC